MTNRPLSEATINAIADLGSDGVRFEEDVRPALAAVDIAEVRGESVAGGSENAIWLFPATTREDIRASLSALNLADSDSVEQVLRFTTRLVDVYVASNEADRVKIIRLRNALADDGYNLNTEDGNVAKFSINKREIGGMMREIKREFDEHQIRVPVHADPKFAPPSSMTIYNGPVIHGDANEVQLAWGNWKANQTQHSQTEQVAPGFETIAQAVTKTLERLHEVGLPEDDRQDAEAAANEALTEVTQAQPDRGKLRRALVALKGLLAPIAAGLATGSTEGAQEWARTAIEQLGTPF